ncbi:MAG: hypothetical protein CMJ40_08560 [Phycisphaerae bacterium]|nr:hypothetical protein [Phycisphaerae bacterium]|tara:strand:+ start:5177 stop:6142 length:966 start_codon:yes stop_codon:yes gene_type:complete
MTDSTRIFYGQGRDDSPPEFTGERFIPGVRGEIEVEHLHRYLFARNLVAGLEVLDIACGEGYGSRLLSDTAKTVVGVDIDQAIVDRASRVHGGDTVRFVQGSCLSIPLADDSIDAVVSYETVEHIEDHPGFMSEIRRVLRSDGLLIMSTPDTNAYVQSSPEENPYHVREMQRSEFQTYLESEFKQVVFGCQRCITGSVMMPLSDDQRITSPGLHRIDGDSSSIEGMGSFGNAGMYLIGIACNGDLPAIDWGFLDDPGCAMVEFMQLKHELAAQHVRKDELQQEYETALRKALDDLESVHRSPIVRIASRIGLVPRRGGDDS